MDQAVAGPRIRRTDGSDLVPGSSRPRRDEWEALLSSIDACFAPVYAFSEAHEHPANRARDVFRVSPSGQPELVPVPRYSRTPGEPRPNYAYPGADTDEIVTELGLDAAALRGTGAIA
jgi:alpha-methylacyl-CoA racemase